MRTSITDIIRTEKFLRGEYSDLERSGFEARLAADPDLRSGLFLQRMVHRMVTLYHRRKIRRDVELLHERLFQDPGKTDFRDSIVKLFNS